MTVRYLSLLSGVGGLNQAFRAAVVGASIGSVPHMGRTRGGRWHTPSGRGVIGSDNTTTGTATESSALGAPASGPSGGLAKGPAWKGSGYGNCTP